MTEFMLSLEDYAAFKNGLDQYYNEVADDDKATFKELLTRLQKNTVGHQQECLGEIFTFCRIRMTEIDLQTAISALNLVCLLWPSEKEIISTVDVLDLINELYKTA